MHSNDLLKIPDPFEQLREAQERLVATHPETHKVNELNRLCYEVFIESPAGIRLMELLKQKVLDQEFNPLHPNANQLAIFNEAMRISIMGLWELAETHREQINAQTKEE